MKAVLNMILNMILFEKPACLNTILTSPYSATDYCYCSVSKNMTPFSFWLYHF